MATLMVDLYQHGGLTADRFHVRALKGVGPAATAKGLTDILLAKGELREPLHRWAGERKFPSAVLEN